jgi:hypothetical protein
VLDQQHAPAPLSRLGGAHHAGGAGADDDAVVSEGQAAIPGALRPFDRDKLKPAVARAGRRAAIERQLRP